MNKIDEDVILGVLREINNEHLDTDLVTLGCVRNLSIDGSVVSFNLKLLYFKYFRGVEQSGSSSGS